MFNWRLRSKAWRGGSDLASYLSEWDDELTQVFFSAVKTDVVIGDEQLSNHVHLSERRPQRAVRVSVQTLVLGQPEHRPVPFILRPRIQIPAATPQMVNSWLGQRSTTELVQVHNMKLHHQQHHCFGFVCVYFYTCLLCGVHACTESPVVSNI